MKRKNSIGCLACCWFAMLFSSLPAPGQTNDITTLAAQILDSAKPGEERNAIISAHPGKAAELMAAMTRDLPVGTPDEYKAIPWIWKVAIEAGKRNDTPELKKLLNVSLPRENQPLHDWQAVVIGGGIINGLSMDGIWPAERINEIVGRDAELQGRWKGVFNLAAAMASDDKIRTGTRYDALRILGADSWENRGQQLVKYLAKGTHGELQQGAICGLIDVKSKAVPSVLIAGWEHFSANNRRFVLDGLLRDEDRTRLLLDAIAAGKITPAALGPERTSKLKLLPNLKLREQAIKILE